MTSLETSGDTAGMPVKVKRRVRRARPLNEFVDASEMPEEAPAWDSEAESAYASLKDLPETSSGAVVHSNAGADSLYPRERRTLSDLESERYTPTYDNLDADDGNVWNESVGHEPVSYQDYMEGSHDVENPYLDASEQHRGVRLERPNTGVHLNNRDKHRDDDMVHFDPTEDSPMHEHLESFPAFFHHPVSEYGEFGLLSRIYLELRQLFMLLVTSVSLGVIVQLAIIHYLNPFRKMYSKSRTDTEFEERITGERLSDRIEYYCDYWGYRCEEYTLVTKGGWILKAHRISDPRRRGGRGYPVVLQHGILCNSLFYFTMEERSLGFWLVDQGYDVWSTNIRSNYGAGHTKYSRSDPRFWAWGLMELADDLEDVVDYILEQTRHRQLAYVGHSQGTGTMFLALSNGKHVSLGHKLSSFTALGPAVFPGPALQRFPFRVMQRLHSRWLWSLLLGVRDFLPPIEITRKLLPAFLFGHVAYLIFGYCFNFHDHNWVDRQKPKLFRATGVQTSSELLYYYMHSFVFRGCIFDPTKTTPWFPRSFPPLSVMYGTIDSLVVGKPLVDRLLQYESNVELVHLLELQGYEHMDMVIGVDAYKLVFPKIKDTIERTRDLEDSGN